MTDRKTTTRQIRIHEDLAEMLSDIADVTGESIAEIIDPILRDHVAETHQKVKPAIQSIKNARAKHRQTVKA